MGLLGWLVLGVVAGTIAKAILPGDDPGGIIVTIIIGIVGAIIGGFLAQVLFGRDTLDEFFDLSTWLTAIVGAIILLVIYRLAVGRGRGRRRVLDDPGNRWSQTPGAAQPDVGAGFIERGSIGSNVLPPNPHVPPSTPAMRTGKVARNRVPTQPESGPRPEKVRDRVPTQPESGPRPAHGVFISYRRQDTQHLAGRLYDRLRDRLGKENVFMDVDSIEPGLDFGEVIDEALRSCGFMLVLIGDKWLTSVDKSDRRRLDDPDDYVRLEIEATLSKKIRVIPVLVEGATMPSSKDLPTSLAPLARRNALEISHIRFDDDARRLIDIIQRTRKTTSG